MSLLPDKFVQDSILNPLSDKYHAFKESKNLTPGQQAAAWIAAAVLAPLTLGLGSAAAFRAIVGHFSKKVPDKDTANRTSQAAQQAGLGKPSLQPASVEDDAGQTPPSGLQPTAQDPLIPTPAPQPTASETNTESPQAQAAKAAQIKDQLKTSLKELSEQGLSTNLEGVFAAKARDDDVFFIQNKTAWDSKGRDGVSVSIGGLSSGQLSIQINGSQGPFPPQQLAAANHLVQAVQQGQSEEITAAFDAIRKHSLPSFAGIDSSKTVSLSVKTERTVPTRAEFLSDPGYHTAPPVIAADSMVPDDMVEHLMRNKKDSALAIKWVNATDYHSHDQITNLEAAMHSFVTPLAKVSMTRDFVWMGAAIGAKTTSHEGRGRPVVMSYAIQPDLEYGKDSQENFYGSVMMSVCEVQDASVQGKPLGKDFSILSTEEKQVPEKRARYDETLRQHLIYHLTDDHRLPSLSEVQVLDEAGALALLETIIAGNGRPEDLKGKAIQMRGHNLSLEVLYHYYTTQLSNELLSLEALCPQGYVYTIEPPSEFVKAIGRKSNFLNRLQALALKGLVDDGQVHNMKAISFAHFSDRSGVQHLQKAVEGSDIQVYKKQALSDDSNGPFAFDSSNGAYLLTEKPWALVMHNNSDGLGQNVETESLQSQDGAVGNFTDAACPVRRDRPDLCDHIVRWDAESLPIATDEPKPETEKAIRSLIQAGDLEGAEALAKEGSGAPTQTFNLDLAKQYAKNGDFEKAHELVGDSQHGKNEVLSIKVENLCEQGKLDEALEVLTKIKLESGSVNESRYEPYVRTEQSIIRLNVAKDMKELKDSYEEFSQAGGAILNRGKSGAVYIQELSSYNRSNSEQTVSISPTGEVRVNGTDVNQIKDPKALGEAQARINRFRIAQTFETHADEIPIHTSAVLKVHGHYIAKTKIDNDDVVFIQDQARWEGKPGRAISYNIQTQTIWIDGKPRPPSRNDWELIEALLGKGIDQAERITTGGRGAPPESLAHVAQLQLSINKVQEETAQKMRDTPPLNLADQRYQDSQEIAMREMYMPALEGLKLSQENGSVVIRGCDPAKLSENLRAWTIDYDQEAGQIVHRKAFEVDDEGVIRMKADEYARLINAFGDRYVNRFCSWY